MHKLISLLSGLTLILAACNSSQKETPSGLRFTVVEAGDGVLPKREEILVFDYQMKDSKDSVWNDTFEEGIPGATMIGDSSRISREDGMTQMFRMLSVGDSVKTTMPVTFFFENIVRQPVPPDVDSTLDITYIIKVRNITTLGEYYELREKQVSERDDRSIEQYLRKNNIVAEKDSSGLQYVIHNRTGNAKPTVENCVEVKYTGRFLKNGEIFDQNDRIAFPLKQVIRGWQQGIPLLGKGDSATLFIPSRLAYGMQGYPGAIPPDAVLIFDVTLYDFGNEYDQKTQSCK